MGFDVHHPPHNLGSSHGHTRAIRKAYFEDPRYVPLLLRSYDLWDQHSQGDTPFVQKTGGLMIGPETCEIVAGSRTSARSHGLEHKVLSAQEMTALYPTLSVPSQFVGLWEADAGLINPERAVRYFTEKATSAGAQLLTHTKVVSWESRSGLNRVRTDDALWTCEHLVFCTGAWSNKLLACPCEPHRVVQYWFKPKSSHFGPQHFPINIWSLPDQRVVYAFPDVEGDGVKLGFHEYSEPVDPDQMNRRTSAKEQAEAEHYAYTLFQGLGSLIRSETCLYTATADRHFIVGPHPQFRHVWLATGFSGHGFKFAPMIGKELAARILDNKRDPLFDLFDPGRFI